MKMMKRKLFFLLIGILSLVNVGFMYIVANPTIGFVLQLVLSFCCILYAILLNKIPKKIHITLAVITSFPVIFAVCLGIYGNISNADYKEDAVIVLGAGVNGETVSRVLAHRLDAAIDYWNKNTDAVIVVTGGLGNRAVITEAEAMARYLISRGVPQEVILLENLSTSTYENLLFAKEILDERFQDGFSAAVITNDFHIYRAVHTAHQIELDVNRYGAYTTWYTWPVNYLREMLAVINMWLNIA